MLRQLNGCGFQSMLRGLGGLVVVVVAVTGVAACASDSSSKAASAATVAQAQEAPVPGGTTVNVSLSENSDTAYVLAADQASVKAGKAEGKPSDAAGVSKKPR